MSLPTSEGLKEFRADLVGKQRNRQSSACNCIVYYLASTMPEGEQSEASTIENSHEATLKNKRKQVRGRITRSIKRLSEGVSKGDTNLQRLRKNLSNYERTLQLRVNCIVSFTIYLT